MSWDTKNLNSFASFFSRYLSSYSFPISFFFSFARLFKKTKTNKYANSNIKIDPRHWTWQMKYNDWSRSYLDSLKLSSLCRVILTAKYNGDPFIGSWNFNDILFWLLPVAPKPFSCVDSAFFFRNQSSTCFLYRGYIFLWLYGQLFIKVQKI